VKPSPRATVTIVLTRHQHGVLYAETLSAVQSAERDEDVAVWSALHAGVSASRWRVPAEHINTAIVYCVGMVDVTGDAGVRRAFAAALRKLKAGAAPLRAPLPRTPGVSAATPGDENR
jgi:hypothetical protein